MTPPIKNLVFSITGFSYEYFLGCLKSIYDNKIIDNVERCIGSSGGSIAASIASTKIPWKKIKKIAENNRFTMDKLIDVNIVSGLINMFTSYGMYSDSRIKTFMNKIFTEGFKNENPSFTDLYQMRKCRLTITAFSLSTNSTIYFDTFLTPNFKVIDAILLSSSIPFIFNAKNMGTNLCVDGGLSAYLAANITDIYKNGELVPNPSTLSFNLHFFNQITDVFIFLLKIVFIGMNEINNKFIDNKNTRYIINIYDKNPPQSSFVLGLEKNLPLDELIDTAYKKTNSYLMRKELIPKSVSN